MTDTLQNFAKHILFLQTDEITSYEFDSSQIQNSLPDIFNNIHVDIENNILTPETAFFHAYIFSFQHSGRDEGFDTVQELKELESFHDLYPDEREEILNNINEALVLFNSALAYDPELQKSWGNKWNQLKEQLKEARYLYAQNNILIFK